MSIRVFATGGTFDKEYNEITGQLFFRNSHLEEMFACGRCREDVSVTTLMMMDSLDMKDEHRQAILAAVQGAAEDRIIITHGTDTMTDTAKVLGPLVKTKTVILTGAMIPFKFGSSDGLFNLGSAVAYANALPRGVWVAMNGRAFPWDNVLKNRATGEFVPVR